MLRMRLAQIRRTLNKDSESSAAAKGQPEQRASTAQLKGWVRAAFLRTVSREPSDEELDRAVTYLRQAPSVRRGLEDLLWALVNTKEFGTNH